MLWPARGGSPSRDQRRPRSPLPVSNCSGCGAAVT